MEMHEQADAGRDCRTRLARPNSQARTGTGTHIIFPLQLTMTRIGNLTLAICDDHTYMKQATKQQYGALFGVTGDWRTAALDPVAWYNKVHEGGCRFMAAWVREEENASNQRQKKREAEEADKVGGCTWSDFSKLDVETFSNRVDLTNPRIP